MIFLVHTPPVVAAIFLPVHLRPRPGSRPGPSRPLLRSQLLILLKPSLCLICSKNGVLSWDGMDPPKLQPVPLGWVSLVPRLMEESKFGPLNCQVEVSTARFPPPLAI